MKPDETRRSKRCALPQDPHCRVILLQCDAAKYGHTLLGGPRDEDKCRTMIFFENSYSADTRDQIEDRIHRRGQTGEYVLYVDMSGSDFGPPDRPLCSARMNSIAAFPSIEASGAGMMTRNNKIAALKREIALRKNVFPKRIRTTGDDAGKSGATRLQSW